MPMRVTAGLENCSDWRGGSKNAERGLTGRLATRFASRSSALIRNPGIKGGCPSMPLSTLHIPETIAPAKRRVHSNGHRQINFVGVESPAKARERRLTAAKPRVFVAAENYLQREALSRVLIQSGDVEGVRKDMAAPLHAEDLLKEQMVI